MTLSFLLLIPIILTFDMLVEKQWLENQSHSLAITSLAFYNDDSKLVSGSLDDTWKVWDTVTYAQLHEEVMSDDVMHISVHPDDNRIFVMVYDGTFSVYDPDNYTLLYSVNTSGVIANTMRFIDDGDNFILGGYEGGVTPHYYIYDAYNYSEVEVGGQTSFTAGEILACDVSYHQDIVALISYSENSTELWNFHSHELETTLYYHTSTIQSVAFHPYSDDLFTCGLDEMVYVFTTNQTGGYEMEGSFDTSHYGTPYAMNANLSERLLVGANLTILVYDLNYSSGQGGLEAYFQDQATIETMQVSHSKDYLVTGMGNGEMSLWIIDPIIIIDPEPRGPKKVKLGVIIGIAVGGVVGLVAVGLIVYFCVIRKKQAAKEADEVTNNSLMGDKNMDDPSMAKIREQLIVIKGGENGRRTDSEKSSDYDYDDLIQGNVIVIKDEEKKKKYIKHLKKQEPQDDDEDDYDKIMTEGTIVVIKDEPLKKGKKKFAEDDDDDPTYEQLMAEGTVIVIKDDEMRRKYVDALKKEKKDKKRQRHQYDDEDSDDPTYQQLMAQGTVIVIKENERKRKLVDFLKNEHQRKQETHSNKSSDIEYDQLMAQGTIVVIKDEEKKKKYVDQLKKQQEEKRQKKKQKEEKKGKAKKSDDEDSDVDYEQLMAEGQIIVIKDDEKKRNYQQGKDEESDDPDYEQLMAEGTVIVIKDDVMKKKYIDHKKIDHENKRGNGHDSDISSDPDYDQIMAEGHIIIIKETDQKKDYFTHLKKDKEILKQNKKKAEQDKKSSKKLTKPPQLLNIPCKKFDLDEESDPDFMNAEADIILINSHKDAKKNELDIKKFKKMMEEEKSDYQND